MNWKYNNPKFEYEEKFEDLSWPWAGHKYFAYDLIANLKPKVIVELGTHYGTSLWSFSQAVKDYYLDTEINAVDTWEGDKHAGFYGEEVFETVNEIKNKYYSNLKINLIRKTFDEAVKDFEDNSIDILHIDGLHTYEAIKHDFETWLPKVKKDGIILLHDIVVNRDDFGIYKFWKELREKYKTMEFRHSYGLGVLFKSNDNLLLESKEELELHYSYLLEDIENAKIANILDESNKKDRELNNLNEIVQQKDTEILRKDQDLTKFNEIIQQKDINILQKDQEIQLRNNEIQSKSWEIEFMKTSKFWKIKTFYEKLKNPVLKILKLSKKAFLVLKRDGLFVFTKKVHKIISLKLYSDKKAIRKWKNYFIRNKYKKNLLYVDRCIPEYDKDAGSFITLQYLKILKNLEYNIIFWPQDGKSNEPYSSQIKKLGIKLMVDKISPYSFFENFGSYINITILSRPLAGVNFIYYIKKYSKSKILYIGHDLHYLREKRGNDLAGNSNILNDYHKTKNIEFSIMNDSDVSLFFSDKEIDIIKKENNKIKTGILPWIEESPKKGISVDINKRNRIVFLGGFDHEPNRDAVKWFHDDIYKLLDGKIKDYIITIIGSNVPQEIMNYKDKNFEIKGYVEEEELHKIFNETRVFVAPLRFGAGFKGKIAKAMSFGVPVVTTAIGAEGIGLEDNNNAMIVDNPKEFAKKIINLFLDENLWKKISINAIKHLQQNYSSENAALKIKEFLK